MDAERSAVQFEFAMASGDTAWLIYLFALAALFLAWWSWRRYGPAPAGRAGVLARCCRSLGLVILVMVLAGPALRWTVTQSEPGRLVLAVDHSTSMARDDLAGERSRVSAAGPLLAALRERFPPEVCTIVGYRIGGRIEARSTTGLVSEPDGAASPLGDELEELVDDQQPDLLLLVSDGRITAGSSAYAVAQDLATRQLPRKGIWSFGVGSQRVEPELRIDEVTAPRESPLGERLTALIEGAFRGLDSDQPLTLELWRGDELLQQEEIEIPAEQADDPQPIPFREMLDKSSLQEKGEQRLRVVLRQGELNSSAEFSVLVVERTLKILILAHRPRYELRYLREALRRDPGVEAHVYLADGRWRPWGEVPQGLEQLPLQMHQLKDYDAIVIGDLGPDRLLDSEIDNIHQAVFEGGTGLIWLPGETGSTANWRGKKLDKLLPVRLPSASVIQEGYLAGDDVTIVRTDRAQELHLLAGDGLDWEQLPPPLGRCPIHREDVIPVANVLLEDKGSGDPLVVVADMGQGRSALVGIDDTWRWRRGLDEADRHLHHFWSQLLRYVAARRATGQDPWRVVVSPRRAVPGEAVQLGVAPTGATADAGVPDRVTVRMTGPDARTRVVVLERPPGESHSFQATIPAPGQGTWMIEAIDLPQGCQSGELVVLASSTELRDPRLDAASLADLSQATGGSTVLVGPEDDIDAKARELVAALPDLARERQRVERRSLWDDWWLLAVLGLLFATEWALRRWHRLP